jgi:hypothetical protein
LACRSFPHASLEVAKTYNLQKESPLSEIFFVKKHPSARIFYTISLFGKENKLQNAHFLHLETPEFLGSSVP